MGVWWQNSASYIDGNVAINLGGGPVAICLARTALCEWLAASLVLPCERHLEVSTALARAHSRPPRPFPFPSLVDAFSDTNIISTISLLSLDDRLTRWPCPA